LARPEIFCDGHQGIAADPSVHRALLRILSGGRWYPQVVGSGANGTDKHAGSSARFFMSGRSDWVINFFR